jgi:hypothetical protein
LEALAIMGFIFGLIAFVRVEKLANNLKRQGLLNPDENKD